MIGGLSLHALDGMRLVPERRHADDITEYLPAISDEHRYRNDSGDYKSPLHLE